MSGLRLHTSSVSGKMDEDAPSEEEVKKARKKRTEAEEHREQSERQYMEAKSAYDTKRQQEETEIRVLLAEAAKELELTSKNLVYSGKRRSHGNLRKEQAVKAAVRIFCKKDTGRVIADTGAGSSLQRSERTAVTGDRGSQATGTYGEKQQQRELSEEVQNAEDRLRQLHTTQEINERIRQNLQKYDAKREQFKEQAAVADTLNRTANGRLSGSMKMDFETYVQRKYFKQILKEANRKTDQNEPWKLCLTVKRRSGERQGKK